jgi:hypothetical protein
MTKRDRRFWIEMSVLVLIVAAIAFALASSELKPLNARVW